MRSLILTVFLLMAALTASVAHAQRPELRAFWVDGFNDGYKTPAQCDTLLARLRAAHCNAVFVQMRKRADAYYASHYEPWAADDPEHFDALEYVCKAAHQPGLPRIQVHAWVNACAIGGNKDPKSITKRHPEWFSLSDKGEDFDKEATKIDPGNPEAADWTYRVYLDIVRHYDIDGIHMDFIRYGGSGATAGHWGYNPVSVARYNERNPYVSQSDENGCGGNTGQPAWDDCGWQQWRRRQVTDLVRRIYVNAIALKPKLIVSAATICWGDGPTAVKPYEQSSSYSQVYAPWRDWLKEGILDLNCTMTYFTYPKRKAWWDNWAAFIKDNQFNRLSAMGTAIYLNAVPDSLTMIQSTREPGPGGKPAAGTVLYSYATTDNTAGKENQYSEQLYAALSGPGVFDEDVPPPVMPWKDHPEMGHIMGVFLRDKETLEPADGATISLLTLEGGLVRTVYCDGNGFFAFVDVPPGEYRMTAGNEKVAGEVQVAAGRVTRITPGHLEGSVTGIGQSSDGAKKVLAGVLVTNGSDRIIDHFFVADGPGKPVLQVNAPGLSPPTVAGDIVAVSGTLRRRNGVPVLDAVAVRHLGAILNQ